MKLSFSSSGIGVEVSGMPSGPWPTRPFTKTSAVMRRARGTGGGLEHGPHVVDRLPRSTERAAVQRLEVFGVRRDGRSAFVGVGDVGRGPAVHLVERALAQHRHDVDPGDATEPFVELEVGVATSGHREPFVERPELLE